tara:strand:- start:76 stop:840 length:765 start_codon:yes stop_codon:yes gene_type:complete
MLIDIGMKKKNKESNILSQGKGIYTHPPLLFSQGYFIFNKINKYLNTNKKKEHKPAKILDLGCAQGEGSFFFLKKFKPSYVIGVDNDHESINHAIKYQKQNKLKKIKFVHKDILDFMKFNKIKYDLIIANGVFPYLLTKKKLSEIFYYVNNSMTNNGVFCFSMFSSNQPFEKKTLVQNINSFSPNNKFNQIALIVNINDLIKILKKNNLSLYNDTFTYQKRYNINIKSIKKINLKADSNFSYFFVIKKDLYTLL